MPVYASVHIRVRRYAAVIAHGKLHDPFVSLHKEQHGTIGIRSEVCHPVIAIRIFDTGDISVFRHHLYVIICISAGDAILCPVLYLVELHRAAARMCYDSHYDYCLYGQLRQLQSHHSFHKLTCFRDSEIIQ